MSSQSETSRYAKGFDLPVRGDTITADRYVSREFMDRETSICGRKFGTLVAWSPRLCRRVIMFAITWVKNRSLWLARPMGPLKHFIIPARTAATA